MMKEEIERQKTIFLIEDNKADIRLIAEGLKTSSLPHQIFTVKDGVEAMAYLQQEGEYEGAPLPELILLDLNLPRKDGREVLAEIKSHPKLEQIPIIVLTTSSNEQDILNGYDIRKNLYITKSRNLNQLFQLVKKIEEFWLLTTTLETENLS